MPCVAPIALLVVGEMESVPDFFLLQLAKFSVFGRLTDKQIVDVSSGILFPAREIRIQFTLIGIPFT